MKAITVEPKKPGTARWEDISEPDPRNGSVLVEAVAVGVCGTDVEIVEGKYGWPPPANHGCDRSRSVAVSDLRWWPAGQASAGARIARPRD